MAKNKNEYVIYVENGLDQTGWVKECDVDSGKLVLTQRLDSVMRMDEEEEDKVWSWITDHIGYNLRVFVW